MNLCGVFLVFSPYLRLGLYQKQGAKKLRSLPIQANTFAFEKSSFISHAN